ncbi:hypothetical protein RB200_10710 [Streptomyces sp. PmtG]
MNARAARTSLGSELGGLHLGAGLLLRGGLLVDAAPLRHAGLVRLDLLGDDVVTVAPLVEAVLMLGESLLVHDAVRLAVVGRAEDQLMYGHPSTGVDLCLVQMLGALLGLGGALVGDAERFELVAVEDAGGGGHG